MESRLGKSKHQQYLRDLENAEGTLERVRSSSKSLLRMNRTSSQKGFEGDVPLMTYTKNTYKTQFTNFKPWEKQNAVPKMRVKPEWQNYIRTYSRDYNIQKDSSYIKQTKLPLTSKINKQYKQPQTNTYSTPVEDLQTNSQQNSEDKFLTLAKNIFHPYSQSETKVSPEDIQKVVKEIELRDKLYNAVASQLQDHNPSNFPELVVRSLQREKVLLKIVKVFKRMSKVDIQDYEELYEFLKEEEDAV